MRKVMREVLSQSWFLSRMFSPRERFAMRRLNIRERVESQIRDLVHPNKVLPISEITMPQVFNSTRNYAEPALDLFIELCAPRF